MMAISWVSESTFIYFYIHICIYLYLYIDYSTAVFKSKRAFKKNRLIRVYDKSTAGKIFY